MSKMSDEIEDDPIIAEHNVYLSHHIARKLFLLEYLPRPVDRPYELKDAQVRVKPNFPKLEMKAPMRDCEEYISDPDYNLVLSSKKPVHKSYNCAFGVFVNDEFHLCSLPEVLELYPEISGNVDSDAKNDSANEEDETNNSRSFSFLTPSFSARVTEAEKNKQLASYQHLKSKEDQDPWIDVISKPAKSHDFNSIIYNSTMSSNLTSEFNMTQADYLELCLPRLNKRDENASKIVDMTPTTKVLGPPEDELVKFAREKLQSRTIMTLLDFQAQTNMAMYTTKTKQELEAALIKAGGVNISNSKTNPMFAIKKKGDNKDPVRECVVNVLVSKPVLKMTYLRSILEKNGLDKMSDLNDLKMILKEYCITKGGSWMSKGYVKEDDKK